MRGDGGGDDGAGGGEGGGGDHGSGALAHGGPSWPHGAGELPSHNGHDEIPGGKRWEVLTTSVSGSGKIQHFAGSVKLEILLDLASIMSELQVC